VSFAFGFLRVLGVSVVGFGFFLFHFSLVSFLIPSCEISQF
jgi:hypothetical protein